MTGSLPRFIAAAILITSAALFLQARSRNEVFPPRQPLDAFPDQLQNWSGTDIAIESAGVTLVKGDLLGIARARKLSQATMTNIRQNLFFAFIYNSAGIPLAAGVLYPFFGLLLSPMVAAAAMALSSVSVIANALRLRRATL